MQFKINKGLDIPLDGKPIQQIEQVPLTSSTFALITSEYQGLKPILSVQVGDNVVKGQELCTDKQYPSVRFLSPTSGIIKAIGRGKRRSLQSIEIESHSTDEGETFDLPNLNQNPTTATIANTLQHAGLWPAFKTRPYSNIPAPDSNPHALFVNAMDTRPLSANPQVVIDLYKDYFMKGLEVLTHLVDQPIYLCNAQGVNIPIFDDPKIKRAEFSGMHPAGLAGTHIHLIEPVSTNKIVWSINYQDVIAIGELFTTSHYPTTRVIALSGPSMKHPRLIQTQLGANIRDLCKGEIGDTDVRIINGSVLDGVRVDNNKHLAYISRFQNQITALPEKAPAKMFAYLRPSIGLFSITHTFLPHWIKKPSFSCMLNGDERAIIPIGLYERVLPLDMLATPLLKSLLVMDIEIAQKLGCLELDEEDLALCTYVCPSKHEFGEALRQNLDRIAREG